MKKIKWLVTVLIVASIALGIIGCSGPSGPIGPIGSNVETQEERFVLIPAGSFQMGSNYYNGVVVPYHNTVHKEAFIFFFPFREFDGCDVTQLGG